MHNFFLLIWSWVLCLLFVFLVLLFVRSLLLLGGGVGGGRSL